MRSLHHPVLLLLLAPAAVALRAPALTAQRHGERVADRVARSQPVMVSRASLTLDGRFAVALLAGAGTVETAAISYSKLLGDGDALEALCLAGGSCSDVLNSPWADVGGVPLAAFGAVAYASALALAVAPSLQPAALDGTPASKMVDTALLGLTAAMAAFSACLMLLLA
eukprot:2698814-Prymnesium_polylepis.1